MRWADDSFLAVRRCPGSGAWFHNCDQSGLTHERGLRAEQRVLFAQAIGYALRKNSNKRIIIRKDTENAALEQYGIDHVAREE